VPTRAVNVRLILRPNPSWFHSRRRERRLTRSSSHIATIRPCRAPSGMTARWA